MPYPVRSHTNERNRHAPSQRWQYVQTEAVGGAASMEQRFATADSYEATQYVTSSQFVPPPLPTPPPIYRRVSRRHSFSGFPSPRGMGSESQDRHFRDAAPFVTPYGVAEPQWRYPPTDGYVSHTPPNPLVSSNEGQSNPPEQFPTGLRSWFQQFLGVSPSTIVRVNPVEDATPQYLVQPRRILHYSGERRRETRKVGIPSHILDLLPVVKYRNTMGRESNVENEEFTSCHICISPYDNDERVRRLPCFHAFHTQCIDKWLEGHRNCPICRLNVDYTLRQTLDPSEHLDILQELDRITASFQAQDERLRQRREEIQNLTVPRLPPSLQVAPPSEPVSLRYSRRHTAVPSSIGLRHGSSWNRSCQGGGSLLNGDLPAGCVAVDVPRATLPTALPPSPTSSSLTSTSTSSSMMDDSRFLGQIQTTPTSSLANPLPPPGPTSVPVAHTAVQPVTRAGLLTTATNRERPAMTSLLLGNPVATPTTAPSTPERATAGIALPTTPETTGFDGCDNVVLTAVAEKCRTVATRLANDLQPIAERTKQLAVSASNELRNRFSKSQSDESNA